MKTGRSFNSKPNRLAFSVLAASLLQLPSNVASAQGPGLLEEVVVTAQRREQVLQDVPLAVTAMSSDQLQTLGVESFNDFTVMAIPGLTAVPFAASPTITSFSMRGVATADPQAGLADSGVAVYLDGIVLGRAAGNSTDYVDVERIEILRGPQGTLFGRNAEGGAIQFVSKRPSGEFGGDVQAGLGNYNQQRYVAHVDLPQFAKVSTNFSGVVSEHDGYTDNRKFGPLDTATRHKDLGYLDSRGFRFTALWEPSEKFDALYTYDYSDVKSTPNYTHRTGGRTPSEPAFCQIIPASCASLELIASNIYTGTQQPEPHHVSTSALPLYVTPNTDDVKGHTLIMSWRPNDSIELKSLTGYRELNVRSDFFFAGAGAFVQFLPTSAFDGAGGDDVPIGTMGAVSGTIATAEMDQNQISQELQLIGTTDRFDYTAGLYYFNENLDDKRDTFFTIPYVYLGQPGMLTPVTVDPFVVAPSLQVYDADAESYAAYAQSTYNSPWFGERLKITLGLRYTHDEKNFTRTEFQSEPDWTKAPKFNKDRWDPALTIAYEFSDTVNSYLRYATGYRAGGVWIRNKTELTTYDPEEVDSWELGLKMDLLDRQMRWNIATYWNKLQDYQVSVLNLPGDPSSTDVVNVSDDIDVYGVENELIWLPTDALQIALTYTYQDTDTPDTIMDLLGNPVPFRQPNTPENQASASIDWTIPMGGMNWVAHLDYAYQDDFYTGATIQPFVKSEPSSVSVLNARLSLESIAVGDDLSLTVALWGRNLTEENDFLFTFAPTTNDFTVANQPGGAGSMGAPTTYGVDVRLDF